MLFIDLVIFLLYLILLRSLSLANLSSSRISNGILYPEKRFFPSEKEFYLGLYKSRDRLRCIKLCQESFLCQTITYDRKKQECNLFSEHIEYGLGKLYEENNKYLITIRLDKDSLQHLNQNKKTKKLRTSFSSYRKNNEETCDNCEL